MLSPHSDHGLSLDEPVKFLVALEHIQKFWEKIPDHSNMVKAF